MDPDFPSILAIALGPEWIIVAGIVVLLFGGSQIPKLARSLGQASKEFKDGQSDEDKANEDKANEDKARDKKTNE